MEKLNKILDWKLNKPNTDEQWANDVKKESLDVKFDYQLKEMEKTHQDKIPKVQEDLDKFDNWSDVVRYDLTKEFEQMFKDAKIATNKKLEGKTLKEWIDEEFASQHNYYRWKKVKLEQSVERIKKERELRLKGFVVANKDDDKKPVDVSKILKDKIRRILGTTYYVDPSTASGQLTGTWTFTNGSTSVTANADGNAVAELAVGDYIKTASGVVWYKIATVTDDDNLVLSRTFLEANVTDGVGTTDNRDVSVAVGTSTANSYVNLHQFTEVARSAGDVCIVRRGTTERIDDSGDLAFTSDGTVTSPITIEADYADAWSDTVDLSGTGTATLTFGSKTVTFSADISSVLSAGDWIYTSGDDAKDFAYEVASVSTVTVTLYLPYKGDQAGAGKTMYNMKAAPIWNTITSNYAVQFSGDYYWKMQGIHLKSTSPNGLLQNWAGWHEFKDMILEGNNSSVNGFHYSTKGYVYKTRVYNCVNALMQVGVKFFIKDSLLDTGSVGIYSTKNIDTIAMEEVEFKNFSQADIFSPSDLPLLKMRNVILGSAKKLDYSTYSLGRYYMEDFNGTIGDNRVSSLTSTDNFYIIQSETTIVRSGGGNTSIKIQPVSSLSPNTMKGHLQLFEYPIYADTTSKTYTVYFKTEATANWTNDPTNTELWIEAEYWGHASNNHRKIDKSTGVIDFNGSTDWQSLTVTVQPSQAGILYLRGWYAKTKEAQSNIFYVDVKPVIS